MIKINLVGKKFGKLLVISKSNNRDKHFRICWLCRCGCGKEKEICVYDLLSGKVKSCGCLKKEHCLKPFGVAAFNSVYNTYIWNSKNRNIYFNLSKEDFKKLISQPCFYCGQEPANIRKNRHNEKYGDYTYNGIDRVDNSIGYEITNCVPCCGKCNLMKKEYSTEDFINHINKILNNFKNKKAL